MDDLDDRYVDRCAHCGRQDVDDAWLWFEVSRLDPQDDCEYAETDLSFCSQAHAAAFLAETEIDWPDHDHEHAGGANEIRADLFMFGCGLTAIALSVIGVVALVLWLF